MNICSKNILKATLILFVCGFLIFGLLLLTKRHEQYEVNADKHTWGLIANQLDEYYFKHVLSELNFVTALKVIQAVEDTSKNKEVYEILELLVVTFPGSTAFIMDDKGTVTVSTPYNDKGDNFTGGNFAFRPYFSSLNEHEYFVYPAVGMISKERGLYFSRKIVRGSKFVGAVVLKIQIDDIVRKLKNENGVNVALMTPDGIIFAASDNKYVFKTFFKISEERMKEIDNSNQFAGEKIENIGEVDRDVLTIDDIPYTYAVINAGYSGWKLLIFKEKSYYKLPLHEFVQFTLVALVVIVLTCIVIIIYKYFYGVKSEDL